MPSPERGTPSGRDASPDGSTPFSTGATPAGSTSSDREATPADGAPTGRATNSGTVNRCTPPEGTSTNRAVRRRAVALAITAALTVVAGLVVHVAASGPITDFTGDALYAVLVYLLISLIAALIVVLTGPRIMSSVASPFPSLTTSSTTSTVPSLPTSPVPSLTTTPTTPLTMSTAPSTTAPAAAPPTMSTAAPPLAPVTARRASPGWARGLVLRAACAYAFCALIELLQLTDFPSKAAAVFSPSALVLGSGFDARDLLAYAVGVAVAAAVDAVSLRRKPIHPVALD